VRTTVTGETKLLKNGTNGDKTEPLPKKKNHKKNQLKNPMKKKRLKV